MGVYVVESVSKVVTKVGVYAGGMSGASDADSTGSYGVAAYGVGEVYSEGVMYAGKASVAAEAYVDYGVGVSG